MDKKLYALITALEQQYGVPVQVSVERAKETECLLYTGFIEGSEEKVFFSTNKEIYGSLETRACEVIPLPTDEPEIQHDVFLLVGRYGSIQQINEKIKTIDPIGLFCTLALGDFHGGLKQHLAQKYELNEKLAYYCHGSYVDWYTVDGVEAELDAWKKDRSDLFKESVKYLIDNKIPFRYNDLVATPCGIYIAERKINGFGGGDDVLEHYFGTNELESLNLTQKIADLKLELL